jgi:hypothetical protein
MRDLAHCLDIAHSVAMCTRNLQYTSVATLETKGKMLSFVLCARFVTVHTVQHTVFVCTVCVSLCRTNNGSFATSMPPNLTDSVSPGVTLFLPVQPQGSTPSREPLN